MSQLYTCTDVLRFKMLYPSLKIEIFIQNTVLYVFQFHYKYSWKYFIIIYIVDN